MKHVMIFEKEEQEELDNGGMIQVDGHTWIQFETRRRKPKVAINGTTVEPTTLLGVPCPECGMQFSSNRSLGQHRSKKHGWKGKHYHQQLAYRKARKHKEVKR
jgi:uncharacterized C2H2 Zn-finger protein